MLFRDVKLLISRRMAAAEFFWVKKKEIDNLLLFAKPDLKSFGSGKYFGGFRQFLPLIAWSKLSTNWKLARIFSRETEWENYCGLVAATTRGFIPLKSVRFLKKCLHDLHFKLSSYILRRPQNFAKSPPCFWLALHRTKVRWKFCKILWPSQNVWTLRKQGLSQNRSKLAPADISWRTLYL